MTFLDSADISWRKLEDTMNLSLQFRELTMLSVVLRPLVAILLGGVIGLERGLKNRAAGFRTYMLVCLGACIVMLTNQYIYQLLGTGDPVRMGAQVISGIGFLGAGTIIVTSRSQIKGLTTAAGLWCSACVGLAVGIGFYELTAICGIFILLVLTLFHRWEDFMRRNTKILTVYVELVPGRSLRDFLTHTHENGIVISNMQFEAGNTFGECVTSFIANIKNLKKQKKESLLQIINEMSSVQYLEEL